MSQELNSYLHQLAYDKNVVVFLQVVSFKVTEPTDAMKWGLTVFVNKVCLVIRSWLYIKSFPIDFIRRYKLYIRNWNEEELIFYKWPYVEN